MTAIDNARTQEIRFQTLHLLDTQRPDLVSEAVLRRTMAHLRVTEDELARELLYLKQRELVELTRQNGILFATLLAKGVDFLEGQTATVPGIGMVETGLTKLELERRKELRWRLLRAADISLPQPISEALAQRVMHDASLSVSQRDLRRVAVYLEQRGYLTIDRTEGDRWLLMPTAEGRDICEYAVDAPVGIGRPDKYWS